MQAPDLQKQIGLKGFELLNRLMKDPDYYSDELMELDSSLFQIARPG